MINVVYANGKDEVALLDALRVRSGDTGREVAAQVSKIIEDVRQNGDRAVTEYTSRFDKCVPEAMLVSQQEIETAVKAADPDFVRAMQNAADNIARYHEKQRTHGFMQTDENGVMMGQRVRGLHSVGLYVPGGTAAYPSSVLMNAIPAKIAGVRDIVMVTPPAQGGANPDILVAASIAGVDKIYLVGGAQAIAALAYGTETIPKVDKIVGPGNIYVTTAKKLLYGVVDIDMVAGPSEILVIADDTADPVYLAADMLSQAEHDVLASAILLTDSMRVAEETKTQLALQTENAPRADIIRRSLQDYSAIIVCNTLDRAVDIANEVAPEHLEVMTKHPTEYLGKLDNAGSIFLGKYSPEPLGDYYAGPNHVLPTSGTARFFSPLSVDSFVKKTSFISYTEKALRIAKDDIILFAQREGLYAHANSVRVRFPD